MNVVQKRLKSMHDKTAVELFFTQLSILIKELNLSADNKKLALNVRNDAKKRFSVNLNSRLVLGITDVELMFMIYKKDLINLRNYRKPEKDEYFKTSKGEEKALLMFIPVKDYLAQKEIIDPCWLKCCRDYLPKNDRSPYRVHHKDILYKLATDPALLADYLADTGLSDNANPNYWIFQGNPNAFDIETALRQNLLDKWTVSAHKDKIKVGDKVIIWVTGKNAGCYALAEVTGEPIISGNSQDDHLWKTQDKNQLKAPIKITHNLIDSPILWKQIENIKGLENLKVGNQGTNFSATKKEYITLLDLALNQGDIPIQAKVIHAFLVEGMSHRTIEKQLLSREGPARGGGFMAMTILHNFDIREDKKGILKETTLNEEIKTARGEYLEALNLLKKHYPQLSANKLSNNRINMSNNIILYGPPGTGKTYHSVDKAVEIAFGKSLGNHEKNKIEFDRLRKEGQVEFVTFHQNYSYEDFMVGIRPDVENESLRFKSHKGIFYELCKRAKENYEAYTSGKGKRKTFEEVLNELLRPLETGKEVEIKMVSGISFWITEVTERSIYFRKQSGGTAHTLSVTSLKEFAEGARESPSGLSSYYIPLINLINQRRETKEEAEPIKNFVLVVDEINRANISKVFGELITLLEDDKRLGADNELKITLPNGEKDFSVPPNLYIIGTMNTADKSIALIDIALRRRFEFIGYYPKYDGYDSEAISLLQKINAAIFEKKKSSDYLIGHAYFMKQQPIHAVLKNKVVPLLMEYFSGKAEIVTSIFEGSGWNVNYDSANYGWNISKT